MKEGDSSADKGGAGDEVVHLTIVLKGLIDQLEEAYEKKDGEQFNILKKKVLQIQKKISEASKE